MCPHLLNSIHLHHHHLNLNFFNYHFSIIISIIIILNDPTLLFLAIFMFFIDSILVWAISQLFFYQSSYPSTPKPVLICSIFSRQVRFIHLLCQGRRFIRTIIIYLLVFILFIACLSSFVNKIYFSRLLLVTYRLLVLFLLLIKFWL